MAGEWIPMRKELEADPGVIGISTVIKLPPDHVVGKLHRLWSWADSHTVDGRLPNVTASWIDGYVGKRGFAEAMAGLEEPWLIIEDGAVIIPNFEHWFGASAKRRMMDTKRKQVGRASAFCPPVNGTKSSLHNSTEQLIAPAHVAADWESARNAANGISAKLGKCSTPRDRRLVLGACALSQAAELGEEWLAVAVRETKDARAEVPYAFLNTVLSKSAATRGVDFKASLSALDIPAEFLSVPKAPAIVSEESL